MKGKGKDRMGIRRGGVLDTERGLRQAERWSASEKDREKRMRERERDRMRE